MEKPTLEPQNDKSFFWKLGFDTIKELEVPEGILASSRDEAYGCVFGRDSLITALKLLKAHQKTGNVYFLDLPKKILATMAALLGKEVNIESGEQPGKCIHEFRTSRYEHLTGQQNRPWYLYPDKVLRNYDSLDATPLFLIAAYRYWQRSGDEAFIRFLLPSAEMSLKWLLDFSDSNGDGFADYCIHPDRKSGGLIAQSWMDSAESVFHEDGSEVVFPVAPVEIQAYSYLALRLWSEFYKGCDSAMSLKLRQRAAELKDAFNRKFVKAGGGASVACGLDGSGKPLSSLRSSIGHCLWASLNLTDDGELDCVLDGSFVPFVVKSLLGEDLFEPQGGIRTLSMLSSRFQADSYHNGSIWPHDNEIIAQGMEQWGYVSEAARVRRAMLLALAHFQTPIELFVYSNGGYREYCSPGGQRACKKQAWSAASLLTAVLP